MFTNDLLLSHIQLSLFEISIIKSINTFYSNIENIELLKEMLINKKKFSIRLIDYFITKYSKNNKVTYYIDNNLFNVFISYKQQLKLYQKKFFDPFSRGIRIPYFFSDNTTIITTIGQLNFYKWFIEKKIYNYIIDNYEIIENNMNADNKKFKDNKNIIKKKYIGLNKKINNSNNTINNFIVSFTF
jgi:hypothetical protein